MTPQTLQTLSQIAIVIGIVLTGLGGFGAYFYSKVIDDQRESDAQVRENALRSDIDRLLEGNDTLQKRIEPFESLARELHPTLNSDEALNRLRDDLESVEQRASALERQAAPRALSTQQQQIVVAVLKNAPSRTIDVTAVMGDAEAFELARQLKGVFEAGGWKVGASTNRSLATRRGASSSRLVGNLRHPPQTRYFRRSNALGYTRRGISIRTRRTMA